MAAGSRWAGLLAALLLTGAASPLRAYQVWDQIPVQPTHVRGSVYAVFGTGANQAILAGEDGLLVVDAGYAELGDRLLSGIRGIQGETSPPSIRYLVDTHWHFDHVGANAAYAGAGATVVAHRATAELMAQDQTMEALDGLEVPAAPQEALPALLFTETLSIAWGGDTVRIVHAPAAHTRGDAVVYFPGADVVHVGDLFFNGMYPFIDVDHGGGLEGMVAACEAVLEATGPETLFIPGHGSLASRNEFRRYVGMLRTVHDRVSAMVAEGMTRQEVVALRPTADLDEEWSQGGGFNEPDTWVGLVYDGYLRRSAFREGTKR